MTPLNSERSNLVKQHRLVTLPIVPTVETHTERVSVLGCNLAKKRYNPLQIIATEGTLEVSHLMFPA